MAEVSGRVAGLERECQPCAKKGINQRAELFCSTCNEFQCNDCSNIHTAFTFMKDHKFETVSGGVTQSISGDTKMAEVSGRVAGVERECRPCSTKGIKQRAELFCSTCNEFQCNDCSNIHSIFTFMKDHQLKTASGGVAKHISAEWNTEVVNMVGIGICEKHNKPFEFYCENDKAITCSSCAIFDHRKCARVTDLATMAARNDDCRDLGEILNSTTLTTKGNIETNEEAETYVNSHTQPIYGQIELIKQTMNELFDEFSDKVTKGVEGYRYATTSALDRSKTECETKSKTLKTIEYTDVRGLNFTPDFDEHFDTLKRGLSSAMSMLNGGSKTVNIVPKATRLGLIVSLDLKQSENDVGEPHYTGLDFLSDDRLVAVDNKNGKCLVYDENLRLLSAYKLPYLHPQCLVAVTDDVVAIATAGSDCKLYFLHVTQSNEITLNKTCKLNSQYYSICMKDNEHFVVGAFDHNPPVRIVSMYGEENYFDIKFPSKNYPVDTSYCTYIRSHDKVVLADRNVDTVILYDVSRSTLCEQIVVKDKIKTPHGLAVGPFDHVFVGSKNSLVVEITPAGRVVTSHPVDMKYIRSLAVSKDGKRLAVSNSKKGHRKLQLYEIQS